MDFPTQFISAGEERCGLYEDVPAPFFRRTFTLARVPVCAPLLICGLGFYELYVNGENITRGALSPSVVNSDHVLPYDAYDLAAYLRPGRNALGVLLGNGMQNAFGGYNWGLDTGSFSSEPKFALRLELEDTVILSDPAFLTARSPIYFDDLRLG